MKLYISLSWFRPGMKVCLLLVKYITSLSHFPRIALLCNVIYIICRLKDWNIFCLWPCQIEERVSILGSWLKTYVLLCPVITTLESEWPKSFVEGRTRVCFLKYGLNSSLCGNWYFYATKGKMPYNFIVKLAHGFALLS